MVRWKKSYRNTRDRLGHSRIVEKLPALPHNAIPPRAFTDHPVDLLDPVTEDEETHKYLDRYLGHLRISLRSVPVHQGWTLSETGNVMSGEKAHQVDSLPTNDSRTYAGSITGSNSITSGLAVSSKGLDSNGETPLDEHWEIDAKVQPSRDEVTKHIARGSKPDLAQFEVTQYCCDGKIKITKSVSRIYT